MTQDTINPRTISGADRGIPSITSPQAPGMSKNSKTGIIAIIVLLLVVMFGIMALQKYRQSKKAEEVQQVTQKTVTSVKDVDTAGLPNPDWIPPEPKKVAVVEKPAEVQPIIPPPPTPLVSSTASSSDHSGRGAFSSKEEADPAQELLNRRYKSGMAGKGSARKSSITEKSNKPEEPDDMSSNFGDMLIPTVTAKAKASKLEERDYLLTKGAMIDCTMVTKIDSTLPGMVKCVVAANVFSDNGKTLLIERGSELTGEYRANIRNGQARVFAIWDRVKTPEGIVANLGSPGADPLGAAGLSGWVDNHWPERLGAAVMLSVLQGALDIGKAHVAGDTGVIINDASDNSEKMVEQVLKSTINIPPTIIKNPGESIRVFVARDVSFSGVYQLKMVRDQ